MIKKGLLYNVFFRETPIYKFRLPIYKKVFPIILILFSSISLAQLITVQPGDTLTQLAVRYNTTIETIIKANDLSSTTIEAGSQLHIFPLYEEIMVDWGDTLTDIARRYGVSVQTLLEINSLSNTLIKVGDVLKVPFSKNSQAVQENELQDNDQSAPVLVNKDSLPIKELISLEGSGNFVEQHLSKLEDDRESIIIQPGDTLAGIARDFNISMQDLMDFNNLSSTKLVVGDVIYINAPPPPPKELHTITVKIGDTLSSLATRYKTTPQAVMRANNLATPFIRTGQTLILPSDAITTPLVDPPPTQPEAYVVQQGDALYKIALKFGIPQERLIAINHLEGTNIYAGQELKLVSVGEDIKPLMVKVEYGDTLINIARRYDVNLSELASANNLSLKGALQVGQELIIPERYAAASELDQGASQIHYITAKKNDTLWKLAKDHKTSVEAIVADNRLSSYQISEGQVIRITPGLDFPPVASPRPEVEVELTPTPSDDNNTNTLSSEDNTEVKVTSGLIWPLEGNITSNFGYRNLVVGGRSYNIHTGIDIDGETGDKVVAASSGKVVFSGWRAGYGYLVVIESLPYHYYYAHASELLVSEGEEVEQGQAIAKVGSTGASTGSHLHFEIRIDDKPQDPLNYLSR